MTGGQHWHQILEQRAGRPALSATAQEILEYVEARPRTTSQIAMHLGRYVRHKGARQDVRNTLDLLRRQGLVEREVTPQPRGTHRYVWRVL